MIQNSTIHEAEFSIIISLACIEVELSNTASPPSHKEKYQL